MTGLRAALFLIAFAVLGTGPLHAIVVNYGSGAENKTDPGFGLPWNYVGAVAGGTSGVYLGSFDGQHWVATATHGGAANFTLGNTTYNYVAGSAVQIAGSDLTLFRIATGPSMTNLTLASSAPSSNALVTLVGFGRVENAYTKWNVNPATNPDTWTVTSGAGDQRGYTTSANTERRWGFGRVDYTNLSYNVGSGDTHAFAMMFADGTFAVSASTATLGSNAVALSMGQLGDSGGAAFAYNQSTSQWELVGILGAVSTYSGSTTPNGQPTNTAVFGNATFAINLAAYSGQIASAVAIPEPHTVALFAGLAALGALLVRSGRKKSARPRDRAGKC